MHVMKLLKDGAAVGGLTALALAVEHLLLYDSRTDDPDDNAILSRIEAYGAGTSTLIGGLTVWAWLRPGASATDAVVVLVMQALIGGSVVAGLHWRLRRLAQERLIGARRRAEMEELYGMATWPAATRRRPPAA